MAKTLTDLGIRSLKHGDARLEIPDGRARGLYLVVQTTGVKSFAVRYRLNGKSQKLTLGRWLDPDEQGGEASAGDPKPGDPISLSAARKLAADTLLQVERGRNPGLAKQQAKEEKRASAANTFKAVAEEYLKREGNRLRSGDRRKRELARLVYPTLGDRPIAEIKRREINQLLHKIAAGELKDDDGEQIKGGLTMADRTLALIRKIMNWWAVEDDDFVSPIVRGMARVKNNKERARDRTLSDDEIRAVWKTAAEDKGPFGPFVQFILLTACRRNEASDLEKVEIAGEDWTLPAARNKTKVELVRPLSKATRDALGRTPKMAGCKFVFSTDGEHPISGFSRFKKNFDKACGVTGWTLHDLRRTARSLMSRAGVLSDHAERCLGHVISGVRGTYDRYEYHAEKKQAYKALAGLVDRIINPRDNVVPLHGAKARAPRRRRQER